MRGFILLKTLLSTALAAFGILASSTHSFALEFKQPRAVVELFTSQGCHSCPPADKLIGKFSKEDDILGLSLHVNYWDYLGWKDSFASEETTKRQYSYGRSLGEGQVYTPQAIVNGRAHVVGSDEGKIRALVDYYENSGDGLTVPINVDVNNGKLSIGVDPGDVKQQATLFMVFFNREHSVKIARGENGGKELTYSNVVHEMQPIAVVEASGFQMNYPVMEIKREGFDSCAIILQTQDRSGNPGPILGAAVLSDW